MLCGVVACKDNDKVVECGIVVVGVVGYDDRLVLVFGWIGGSWELKELPRELYPN